MVKHKLPSGAQFEIHALSFEKAWEITQIVLKEFESVKLDLKSTDFKELMGMDVFALKGPICGILSSQTMVAAAKKCFAHCLYNNARIDENTFDSSEARGDFIFCCFYALKENVYPFFASLISSLNRN